MEYKDMKNMENKNGPEIHIGEHTNTAQKGNSYLKEMETAAGENRLEACYQTEKNKLTARLKHSIDSEDKELTDSILRDISVLEEAYRIVNKGGNSKNAVKICPKCGREYEHDDDSLFCEEDGTKLIELWKCRYCGEDLTKAQGYSAIKVCPNCGNALEPMQQKSINNTKSGEANVLKKICANEKCGASYENSAKFCKKCGSSVMAMQCACGENFRQKEDGGFDKYCPKCGSLSPIALHIIEEERLRLKEEENAKKAIEEKRRRQWEEICRKQKEENRKKTVNRKKEYKVGDIIKFGSYPYETDGTEKPIEWIILEKYSDGKALVISKYGLDAVR
jgi:ribosomal protein L40E